MLSAGWPHWMSRRSAARRGSARPRVVELEPRAVPAVFVVDSTLDAPDARPGDGVARTADGLTTLRAAVMEAAALPGPDAITLLAGTYSLTVAGAGEDGAAAGDLDAIGPLTMTGAGAAKTHIDGAGLDRIFDVRGGSLYLEGVTLTGGIADSGGAVRVGPEAALVLVDAVVRGNRAERGDGGGVLVDGGALTARDTLFEGNAAGAVGGAVAVRLGSADLGGSAFVGNQAKRGGGLGVEGGAAVVITSTFSGNVAAAGGAVSAANGVPVDLVSATLTANRAADAGGVDSGGTVSLFNTVVAGNFADSSARDVRGLVVSQGANFIGTGDEARGFGPDDVVGTGAAPLDPWLTPLVSIGGLTPVHVPMPGSPLIDRGAAVGVPAADQRGVARPQHSAPDVGAVEARTFTLANLTILRRATVGTDLAGPLQIQLREGDVGLPGVPVTFIAPASGAGGSFNGLVTVLTDANGIATAPPFAANTTAGAYAVQATVAGAMTIALPLVNDPGPVAAVLVDVPAAAATAGVSFPMTVTLTDAYGNVATNFTGAVALASDDGRAVLPATLEFTAADAGRRTVDVELRLAGARTIGASVVGGPSGSAALNVVAGPARRLTLAAPAALNEAAPFTLTLTAWDEFDNRADGFTGVVRLASSDAQATLPATITFVPADGGIKTIPGVSLHTPGAHTVSAAADGLELADTAALAVANVGPSDLRLTHTPAQEGRPVELSGTFVNPDPKDTHTLRVSWGDGSPEEIIALPAGVTEFRVSHTYAANRGGYPLSVSLADDFGSATAVAEAIPVANVAPTATLPAELALLSADRPFVTAGSFTDPGADAWTATVDFGDGTGTRPLALNADKGFALEHVYTYEGTYTVLVTIRDGDGGVSTVRQRVAVFLPGTTGMVVQVVKPGTSATATGDGVSATFRNDGEAEALLVVANVDPVSVFGPGVSKETVAYDVRLIGATPRGEVTVTLHYPAGGEQAPSMLYYDTDVGGFLPVRGSKLVDPSVTWDAAAGTVTAVLDGSTSAPTLTGLGGTLFTLTLPGPAPTPSRTPTTSTSSTPGPVFQLLATGPTVAAPTDAPALRAPGSTTGLVSSSRVVLTLAASDGLRRSGIDNVGRPSGPVFDPDFLRRVFDTLTDLRSVLIETLRMWIDEPPPMAAPAQPAPADELPDAVRIDDLAAATVPAAPAVIDQLPVVLDPLSDDAIPVAAPAGRFEQDRTAALLTGLWLGGAALQAAAPDPAPAHDEEEQRRRANRARWKPRRIGDVEKG